ncbi:hypothetical protein fugu_012601 [Takifugu bimaculatus]|uniref:Uncharacterized protein n=1 Tax=Takifugu bimaculatus TaxID=433685 RepID=A0A4Z2C5X8_9TELE|nr:hypothetical protein fugu_012601 [Takifugu bimaculatus]
MEDQAEKMRRQKESAVIPATYEVLPPTVGPLRVTDVDQNPNTASDGYLVWMKKKQQSLIQSAIKAEKMRRQKENAKLISEQNKKINEKAFVPTKESKDKKEVPRMKDAQLNRGENQQDLSFSLYHLPKQLQVPEMRAELKDAQTSLSTTSGTAFSPDQNKQTPDSTRGQSTFPPRPGAQSNRKVSCHPSKR